MISLAAGCLLGVGLSLLWPRGDVTLPNLALTGTPTTGTPGTPSGTITPAATGSATAGESTQVPTILPQASPTAGPIGVAPGAGDGTTRTGPIAFRNTAQVDTTGLQLTMLQLTRPATAQVSAASPSSATPAPGQEYLQMTISFSCKGSDTTVCTYSAGSVKALGADGTAVDLTPVGLTNEDLAGQITGGSSKQLTVTYLVTEGDESVVLFYTPPSGNATYFALK